MSEDKENAREATPLTQYNKDGNQNSFSPFGVDLFGEPIQQETKSPRRIKTFSFSAKAIHA